MSERYIPQGVIPAVLLPFDQELEIDEAAYRSHLRNILAVEGVSALTVNGHSSEVHALSIDEQRRVLNISIDEVGKRLPIVCGIYADGTQKAVVLAKQAEAAGARCLLIFPSSVFLFGAVNKPDMVISHFRRIAEATNLSLIAFVYPLSTGLGYPPDCLVKLVERIPQLVSIKDWCNNPVQHEKNIRLLHSQGRSISVLTTHSAWLMASLLMGADGLLSGAGSVIATLQVQLWNAVANGDLAGAREINDRIWPMTDVFYSDPFLDMHNRMKEALVLLGRQESAHVRPPLMKLSGEEIEVVRKALVQGRLL